MHKIEMAVLRNAVKQRAAFGVTHLFQPICGSGKPVSGINAVWLGIRLSVATLPSSEKAVINCIPKQIPSTG